MINVSSYLSHLFYSILGDFSGLALSHPEKKVAGFRPKSLYSATCPHDVRFCLVLVLFSSFRKTRQGFYDSWNYKTLASS
jgi:hypothetical protein